MLDIIPSSRRVTYYHPSLSRCGVMTGMLQYDVWEGHDLFTPDPQHIASVVAYGYDADVTGLYLHGGIVVSL